MGSIKVALSYISSLHTMQHCHCLQTALTCMKYIVGLVLTQCKGEYFIILYRGHCKCIIYYILYNIYVIMLSLSVCVCVHRLLSIMYIDVCVIYIYVTYTYIEIIVLKIYDLCICMCQFDVYVCCQRQQAPALYCNSPCTSLEQCLYSPLEQNRYVLTSLMIIYKHHSVHDLC